MSNKEETIAPIRITIDGVLDLHTFRPADIKSLIPAYIEECRRADILAIRIIHGKGKGILRRTVHAILAKLPEVASFKLATEDAGNWGATLVDLHPE